MIISLRCIKFNLPVDFEKVGTLDRTVDNVHTYMENIFKGLRKLGKGDKRDRRIEFDYQINIA